MSAGRRTPDAGRLFVKWSPGSKTHKKLKISWFLKKKKFFFFGRMDENKINFVTQKLLQMLLWHIQNQAFDCSDLLGFSTLPNRYEKESKYLQIKQTIFVKKPHYSFVSWRFSISYTNKKSGAFGFKCQIRKKVHVENKNKTKCRSNSAAHWTSSSNKSKSISPIALLYDSAVAFVEKHPGD